MKGKNWKSKGDCMRIDRIAISINHLNAERKKEEKEKAFQERLKNFKERER